MTTLLQEPKQLVSRAARYIPCACVLTLMLLCAVAFANSYRGALVYDDGLCLLQRNGIDKWWPENRQEFTTGPRRWLTHLTFVANYKLHGYWVPGYHVVNNVIHLLAGLYLFGLVRRTLLLPPTRERYARSAAWLALGSAAIWLVHPLQTESVTYVVQRLESLAGMLFLLSLYLVLRGSQSRYAWPWYVGAVVVIWIGTGSKETMFLAPLAVLMFDRAYLASSWQALVKQRWALHAATLPALVWSAFWLKGNFTPGTKSAMGFGFQGVSPWEYLRTQPEVILHYLRLTFWPEGQCLDYAWPVQDDPRVYLGLGAIVLALVIASLVTLWHRPRIGFVAFMFFFVLAPTSSFMPIRDLAFEHRMYLSLASVVILAVLALDALCRSALRSPIPRVAIPAVTVSLAIGAFTVCTLERNRLYHDPVEVWRDVMVRAPWNARGAYNLGQLLIHRGMVIGGRAEYEHLTLHDPKAIERIANRFEFTPLEGDLLEAVEWCRRAIELDPQDASPHFNLGGLYDRAWQSEAAIACYQQALELKPSHLPARMNLARLLAERGDREAAVAHYLQAIEIAPNDARPYTNYGKMLADEGRHQEAIEQFRAARKAQPEHLSSRCQLALSLWEIGEQREAIGILRDVRRTHANLTDVNLALARFLAQAGQPLRNPASGAALAQQTIDATRTPLIEGYAVLATCQMELGRYDLATATIERGLALADPLRDEEDVKALSALLEKARRPALTSSANASSS